MTADAARAPLVLVAACALIDRQGRVLLTQRPEGKSLAGLWEFPGGKIEENETPEQALARELGEELGIMVETRAFTPLTFSSHAYSDFHLLMPVFGCRHWSGEAQGLEGQELAWVAPEALGNYPMPPADEPLQKMLLALLSVWDVSSGDAEPG